MKKTNRIKLPQIPVPQSRDDAESLMNDLAATVNNQRVLTAHRDAEILRVNETYATDIALCEQTMQQYTETLRAWAEANPDQFPKDRKSIKMLSGTLGFRTGTPKLALLSRSWTWEKVLNATWNYYVGWVRHKPELDKEVILASHAAKEALDQDLKAIGLRVTQDESFFVEPDLTPFENRKTTPAT